MTTDLVQWLRPRKGVTAHFASWGWPSDLPLYLKLGGLFQTEKRAGEEGRSGSEPGPRQRAQVFNRVCVAGRPHTCGEQSRRLNKISARLRTPGPFPERERQPFCVKAAGAQVGAETAQVHLPVEIWGRRFQEEAEPEGDSPPCPCPAWLPGRGPSQPGVCADGNPGCLCVGGGRGGGVLSVCPVSQASSQVRPLIQVGQG